MNDRCGQVWACIDVPEMVRVLVKLLPLADGAINEEYLAFYVDESIFHEFDTQDIEYDPLWVRLA